MRILPILCLPALLFTNGCFIVAGEDGSAPPEYFTGTLIVDWTIDGSKDPYECQQGDVDSISVVIESLDGDFFEEYEQSCETFATSIALEPGDYVADIVLLDPTGAERTTAVRVRQFQIYSEYTEIVPVDFPASAFY